MAGRLRLFGHVSVLLSVILKLSAQLSETHFYKVIQNNCKTALY